MVVKKEKEIIIAPKEIVKVISSIDKKSYVYISNKGGKLFINLTESLKNK